MAIFIDKTQHLGKETSWNKSSNFVSGIFSKICNVTTMNLKEKYNLSFLKDNFHQVLINPFYVNSACIPFLHKVLLFLAGLFVFLFLVVFFFVVVFSSIFRGLFKH